MNDDFRNIGRAHRVNLRDEEERTGAGGLRTFLFGRVSGEGKSPQRSYTCIAKYSDGSVAYFTGAAGMASSGLASGSGHGKGEGES